MGPAALHGPALLQAHVWARLPEGLTTGRLDSATVQQLHIQPEPASAWQLGYLPLVTFLVMTFLDEEPAGLWPLTQLQVTFHLLVSVL